VGLGRGRFHFWRRPSPEASHFGSASVRGGTAKTDFMVQVGDNGETPFTCWWGKCG